MPEIISRKEAVARGLKRYFTGPCGRGHTSERTVSSRACLECDRMQALLSGKNAEYSRNWRKRNPEKAAEQSRRYRAANRDKCNAMSENSKRKIRDLIAVLRKEMPELLEEFGL